MRFSPKDRTNIVPSGTTPDYDINNPLHQLIRVYESVQLAAEREHYSHELLEFLFPFESLELYGPQSPRETVINPVDQDFVDFQKQNIQSFVLGDMHIVRGWVTVDSWTGPFLRLSYRGGPDSALSKLSGHTLSNQIRVFLKVGSSSTSVPLVVPYNADCDRYEVELWNYPGEKLKDKLDFRGRESLETGALQIRGDLIQGASDTFARQLVSDQSIPSLSPNHLMHPTNPVRIELAWADDSLTFWDSREGRNHIFEFSMVVRGWDHFLKVGSSSNPHGGVGKLEYRNLLSNYFEFQNSNELGRTPQPWSKDAFGEKFHDGRREPFLAVDYMDLHIVPPNGGIGIHRHRDNQEIFMVLENEVVMICGDWCEMPFRQRAFEVRTLRAGHFALLKAGQLHGLLNPTDEDIPLLMFGGYD